MAADLSPSTRPCPDRWWAQSGRGLGLPASPATGNPAGILGRLTLGVVEIGRHGNHRLRDVDAEKTSAVSFILVRMNALIWLGEYFLPLTSTHKVAVAAGHVGHHQP